jgi:uncharacterized protein (TIGR02246 family)
MRASILALPVLTLAVVAPAQARDIRSEIEAANARWVAAYNKGDAAAVAQLYTEQATILPPGAPLAKGRAAIQAVWQGAMSGMKNVALKIVQVEQFGSVAREIGEFGGETATGHVDGKYVVLWRRVGGSWKLDTDIWNANK